MVESMDKDEHWQRVYALKKADEVSWYAAHLGPSLSTIKTVADVSEKIIDIGGGASTLVDDLLGAGYGDVSVLDISSAALDAAKERLGDAARRVTWIVGDVTSADLPAHAYGLWHDRAVFHFLTDAADRFAYVRRLEHALKNGGRLVVSTFAPDGPSRCSGLDVIRYDAGSLAQELGPRFLLESEARVTHRTPSGSEQKFIHCLFRKIDGAG